MPIGSVPESGEFIPRRGTLSLNFVTRDCQQISLQCFSTWGGQCCEVPSEPGTSVAAGGARQPGRPCGERLCLFGQPQQGSPTSSGNKWCFVSLQSSSAMCTDKKPPPARGPGWLIRAEINVVPRSFTLMEASTQSQASPWGMGRGDGIMRDCGPGITPAARVSVQGLPASLGLWMRISQPR